MRSGRGAEPCTQQGQRPAVPEGREEARKAFSFSSCQQSPARLGFAAEGLQKFPIQHPYLLADGMRSPAHLAQGETSLWGSSPQH